MNPVNFPFCFLNRDINDLGKHQKPQKSEQKRQISHQEMKRIRQRLQCPQKEQIDYVMDMIQAYFPGGIGKHELLMVAVLLSDHLGIHLDRDAKRRRKVLLTWYWEHWARIFPYLKYVRFECDDGHTLTREEMENAKIVSVLHQYKGPCQK